MLITLFRHISECSAVKSFQRYNFGDKDLLIPVQGRTMVTFGNVEAFNDQWHFANKKSAPFYSLCVVRKKLEESVSAYAAELCHLTQHWKYSWLDSFFVIE